MPAVPAPSLASPSRLPWTSAGRLTWVLLILALLVGGGCRLLVVAGADCIDADASIVVLMARHFARRVTVAEVVGRASAAA